MRTLLNLSWLRVSLLTIGVTLAIPLASATATQATRQPAVSAYNRPSATAMSQFGADSTVLNAQDLALPLMARLDVPVLSDVSWTVATVSSVGDGLQIVSAAPTSPASSAFISSRLPESSPWAGMVATMMLVAFFLFRRAQ